MPEITIQIGGRDFDVVCKDGEEPFLRSAAAMLDTEATVLTGAMGRIPESRMLLMSGLMLADKTASLEDQLAAAARESEGGQIASEVKAQIAELQGDLSTSQDNLKAAKSDTKALNKELEETKANLETALEAMDRMVTALEEKSA